MKFLKGGLLVALALLVLLVGPSLISQDLRFNAIPLYFSRPLRRFDYFVGKLGVIGARVFADDHTFVNLLLRPDKQPPALLDGVERIGSADAVFHRHEHAVVARWDFAFERRVFFKQV